jgi:pimeloyl-ACP methyl ester carboxylesterase
LSAYRLPDGAILDWSIAGNPSARAIVLNRPIGGSKVLWGQLVTCLSRSLRVVSFDPRGVGASSDVPPHWSTRAMARDAVHLLDGLGIARAHVFGLSLGGMVAMWMAADAPERVIDLILASTLPRPLAISRRATRHGLPMLRALLRGGRRAEAAFVRQILSHRFRRAHPERARTIESQVLATRAKTTNFLWLAKAAILHEEPPLERITARTLLVSGALDRIAGRHSREELLLGLAHAELEVFPNVGHDLSLEAPALLAERILRFVGS